VTHFSNVEIGYRFFGYPGSFTLAYPPTLTISGPDTNGYVQVSWPTIGFPGYQLQFNPDLTSTNWVPVDTTGFFRLVKP